MTKAAWERTVLGSKQAPPAWMGLQSIPLLHTYSMFACNALSSASAFATQYFLPAIGDGFSVGGVSVA